MWSNLGSLGKRCTQYGQWWGVRGVQGQGLAFIIYKCSPAHPFPFMPGSTAVSPRLKKKDQQLFRTTCQHRVNAPLSLLSLTQNPNRTVHNLCRAMSVFSLLNTIWWSWYLNKKSFQISCQKRKGLPVFCLCSKILWVLQITVCSYLRKGTIFTSRTTSENDLNQGAKPVLLSDWRTLMSSAFLFRNRNYIPLNIKTRKRWGFPSCVQAA